MTHIDLNKKAFLYKTTNKINGKTYIGVRTYKNTKNDDKYFGSGKAIKSAIKQYGINNFERKILLIGLASYCYEIERHLVDKDWVESPDNYNICLGGWGGTRGEDAIRSGAEKQKQIWKNLSEEEKLKRKEFLNSIRPAITETVKKGRDVHNWSGWWLTPLASFIDCREAAKFYKIDSRVLRFRCKTGNDQIIKRAPTHSAIIPEWIGLSWKELGWGFHTSEDFNY